ncbi:serpin family protein [Natronosporangium hydrolyticum]|uniref:Serpin family protein n=1 Tax=Natronosporangium hydrolyticum TaxID=2811111 RepID=A0A895YB97_9ACTN|nr:serpin family protein [Natronosporangium hydrolyticum]QSB15027.1 serpin family protein [Natronosporangium hydrolyticum]
MERAHLDSALALHRQLPETGNLGWSPYSVAAALGLAAAGARGATRDELARALAGGESLPALAEQLAASATLPDAEVAVANSLWLDQRLRCRDDYQRQVTGQPGGAVHGADFRHHPDDARREINDDVEQTTRGLIRELLQPGMLSRDTAAVIVNALYLKIAWLTAFAESATKPAPFHAPEGVREVPTMRLQERVPYAAADGWRLASLPTASTVAVDILLPPAGADPAPPPPELVLALQRSAKSSKLELALPRFRVESAAVLNDPLRALGVVTGFQPGRADFTGVTEDERIFLDLVLHKAVVKVDEEGFEGAAATAVVMRTVSMDLSTPVPFHVDRPFLVLVRHRRTGAIYFLARVVSPHWPE